MVALVNLTIGIVGDKPSLQFIRTVRSQFIKCFLTGFQRLFSFSSMLIFCFPLAPALEIGYIKKHRNDNDCFYLLKPVELNGRIAALE